MFLECVSVPGSSAGLNSDPWWSDTLSERVFQVKDETNSQQVVLVQILKVQTGRKKKRVEHDSLWIYTKYENHFKNPFGRTRSGRACAVNAELLAGSSRKLDGSVCPQV